MQPTSDSRATSAPLAKPPQTAGSWQLGKLIGRGQFADVLEARPPGAADAEYTYAVKRLRAEWEHEPLAIRMFAAEVRVASEVTSPHLLPVLSSHLRQSPYYLAMPRLVGTTLDERLKAHRRPSMSTALWTARQVAEALAALHQAGWTHGDVKPGNIFISPEGHVTLIDLGFARHPGEEASTAEQAVVGTPHYLAPELLSSTLRGDIRGDLYSLGIVLFEALTGKRPLEGQSMAELASAHRQKTARKLRRELPQAAPEVAKLIESMLAKQPLRRPQTPSELVGRLMSLEIDLFAERRPVVS